MIFGKKKEEQATNPYYKDQVVNSGVQSAENVQSQPVIQPQAPQTSSSFQQVVLPTPLPPPPAPSVSQPQKVMEPPEKPFAFVRVDEFKQIINNLKEMDSYIDALRTSADELSKIVEQEGDIIKRYISAHEDLKRAIDEIKVILSSEEK